MFCKVFCLLKEDIELVFDKVYDVKVVWGIMLVIEWSNILLKIVDCIE